MLHIFFTEVWALDDTQNLADKVAELVQDKFNGIKKDPKEARHRVFAGIVMTTENDLDTAKVITLATGTKGIKGGNISRYGETVNDSHAEILACRCLRSFLFQQIQLFSDKNSDSIFDPRSSMEVGYRLKNSVQFHLYISTAPCGAARVETPPLARNSSSNLDILCQGQGQLRTKVEASEGTCPVQKVQGVQTLDGIFGGEQLLTMSCSDKLAKWNVLGIQG